jgi:hypothetical protein
MRIKPNAGRQAWPVRHLLSISTFPTIGHCLATDDMKQTFRSGIWLLAATLVSFGGIYPVEKVSDWEPIAGPIVMSDIRGSTGAGSPIEHGARQHDLPPLAHEDAAIETKQGIRTADPWEVKRFRTQGLEPKLISVATPVLRAQSKVSFARAQCNDWEKHIKSLDETALRPLPDFDQDRIERERKKAREMMLGLDCTHEQSGATG